MCLGLVFGRHSITYDPLRWIKCTPVHFHVNSVGLNSAGLSETRAQGLCTTRHGGCRRSGTSVSRMAAPATMTSGSDRSHAWAAVLAAALVAACSAASGAAAQIVSVDITNSTLVLTSAGFAQALRTSHINQIFISCAHLCAPDLLHAASTCMSHAMSPCS